MLQKADVLVIDAPRGASLALGAFRPQHERTHLICRWPDEFAPAFASRVSRQLNKVKQGAQVAAMTLVLGGDPAFGRCLLELGPDLAAAVAPSGSLTLMGIGAAQSEVVAWFELLRNVLAPSVKLDAWFPVLFPTLASTHEASVHEALAARISGMALGEGPSQPHR